MERGYEDEKNSLLESFYDAKVVKRVINKIEIKESVEKAGYTEFRILITSYAGSKITTGDTNRRYSEFEKLHIYFKQIFDTLGRFVLFPKLPGKHGLQDRILGLDENARREFDNERKEDLEIYLNLLIEIDKARDDSILKEFLTQTPLNDLNKEIEKARLNVPHNAPEKVIQAVQQTFQSVYKIFESWNVPNVPIEDSLKEKITKIEEIKVAMNELLANEVNRLRILRIKEKELNELEQRRQSSDGALGIIENLKKKMFVSEESPNSVENIACIQMLHNFIEEGIREENKIMDKIEVMKKDIKTVIARCDAVLTLFTEITSQKSETEARSRLPELDKLIDISKYIEYSVRLLGQYKQYYSTINRLDDKCSLNRLDRVEEEEEYDGELG